MYNLNNPHVSLYEEPEQTEEKVTKPDDFSKEKIKAKLRVEKENYDESRKKSAAAEQTDDLSK